MEFGVQKLAMAAAIAAVAWLGGALPIWAGRDSSQSPLLSWGNALAAGILLGIGLIHMLAESATAFEEQGFHYPIAYLLAAGAFLALLLLEHVVLPDSAHQAVHARSGEAHHALDAGDHAHEFAPYALIGALSVHSVFAGVTLGAQAEFGQGLALFSGLLAHKAVEGLALGVSLARSGLASSRGFGILGLFALLTPAGIALGASVAGILDAPGSRLFESASLALAGGTFLYIASLDLTRDEYLKPGKAWQKWACTALGVALTALLAW
jgi:zinc transporter 1/2/3